MQSDNDLTCPGPLTEDCEKCELFFRGCKGAELKWYSRLPFFIIDNCLNELSGSAVKVFLFLNRRANFQEGSNNYGRCWATYEQIEEVTGVKKSNMRKYMRELEKLNLVDHTMTTVYDHKNKQPKTVHQFTIKWYAQLKRLKKIHVG